MTRLTNTISGKINLVQYFLCHFIAECTGDFKDEEMAFQYLESKLGIKVLLTPSSNMPN
jgi:hypothetical protein